MDGIMSLHEIMHYTHIRKKVGIVIKLDIEKAYDKVNWEFLLKCLENKGFGSTWCGWMRKIIQNGTVSVKLNNTLGP